MALLALIGTRITTAGHVEAQLATNLRANAIAEAAADGAARSAVTLRSDNLSHSAASSPAVKASPAPTVSAMLTDTTGQCALAIRPYASAPSDRAVITTSELAMAKIRRETHRSVGTNAQTCPNKQGSPGFPQRFSRYHHALIFSASNDRDARLDRR